MKSSKTNGKVQIKPPAEGDMSPTERLKVLLFLALFSGATGVLFTLLSCGTEYWLLAAEEKGSGKNNLKTEDSVRIFHEGLFWRCFFMAGTSDFSIWDLWITNRPLSKICQPAFLFPFPVNHPAWTKIKGFPSEPYEHPSAIALCLLAVVMMYLMWVQVLDTLEQFALHQRVSVCPSYHLSIQHGPSFLLAPVAAFFCLLAGLFILVGQSVQGRHLDKKKEISEPSETEL
ncbi:transmembrane protein 182-like isoform X2 [Girardinichthys multiradiatus]|uniref:transmembrane protein 182-like isoform X2 n=1 Tax=Girardinichthys multiradiatus TaxID=208333 RepID=UPI001FABD001|nr:transmembrane protein 182-like isoform X2 [Girardinichthys multiradiatus]